MDAFANKIDNLLREERMTVSVHDFKGVYMEAIMRTIREAEVLPPSY